MKKQNTENRMLIYVPKKDQPSIKKKAKRLGLSISELVRESVKKYRGR